MARTTDHRRITLITVDHRCKALLKQMTLIFEITFLICVILCKTYIAVMNMHTVYSVSLLYIV